MRCMKLSHLQVLLLYLLTFVISPATYGQLNSTNTIAAIWKQDTATNDLKFLGTGALVNTGGHIITARHVIQPDNQPLVEGERLVVSLGTKSAPYYDVFSTNCHPNSNIDTCIILIAGDSAQKQGIQEEDILKISCYAPPKTEWDILVAGFTGFPGAPVLQRTGSTSIGFAVPAKQLFATEVQLIPGMSGGPVLDKYYKIIGVVHGADEASRNLGLFTPTFTSKSLIENIGIECPTAPDELSEFIPIQFFPKPRVLDFRTLLDPHSGRYTSSQLDNSSTVISLETISYANVQDPGPKARVSNEKLQITINDSSFDFEEFQRVNIGTNGEGWLGRLGDPVAVTLEQGEALGHTTQFKPASGSDFSWIKFKNHIKSGASIKVNLTATTSWKFQSKLLHSDISVACDPSPREEEIARNALVEFEEADDIRKSANRLAIYCRDNSQ